jgi:hypothetical protein
LPRGSICSALYHSTPEESRHEPALSEKSAEAAQEVNSAVSSDYPVKWTSRSEVRLDVVRMGDELRARYSKLFSTMEFIFTFDYVLRREHSLNLQRARLLRLQEHLVEEC